VRVPNEELIAPMSVSDDHSRVTNRERFRPLHEAALALVSELQRRYMVEEHEGSDLEEQFQNPGIDRASLRLVPEPSDAAPLEFVFSSFPGVAVGFGFAAADVFPRCGCDACGETLEGELERLRHLVQDVTAGRLEEVIKGRSPRRWRWERWSEGRRSSGSPAVPRRIDWKLRWWQRRRIQWRPWQRRPGPQDVRAGEVRTGTWGASS
jgi:hypothetical protein